MKPEFYAIIGTIFFILWLTIKSIKLAREKERENAIIELARNSKTISKELKKQNEILTELVTAIKTETAPAEQDPQEQA